MTSRLSLRTDSPHRQRQQPIRLRGRIALVLGREDDARDQREQIRRRHPGRHRASTDRPPQQRFAGVNQAIAGPVLATSPSSCISTTAMPRADAA
jgi:hypothetical protein